MAASPEPEAPAPGEVQSRPEGDAAAGSPERLPASGGDAAAGSPERLPASGGADSINDDPLALMASEGSASAAERANEMRLFVGGLPDEAESEDLRDHFRRYGRLSEAAVIRDRPSGRSRGFGFVTLLDPSESVRKDVLQEFHEIRRKKVTVRLHDSVQGKVGSSSGSAAGPGPDRSEPKRVFIGGLEAKVGPDVLREAFARFGEVTDVFIAKDAAGAPKRFGFVTLDTSEAVQRALDAETLELKGVRVQIKVATRMRQDAPPHSSAPGPPGHGPPGGMCPPPGFPMHPGYGSMGYGMPPPGYMPYGQPPYGCGGYHPAYGGAYGGYPGYGPPPGYPGYPGYPYGPYGPPPGGGYGPAPPPSSGHSHHSHGRQPY